MINARKKIWIAAAVVVAAVVIIVAALSLRGTENFGHKYEGQDLSTDVAGMERLGTYSLYLAQHDADTHPAADIEVDLSSCRFEKSEADARIPQAQTEQALAQTQTSEQAAQTKSQTQSGTPEQSDTPEQAKAPAEEPAKTAQQMEMREEGLLTETGSSVTWTVNVPEEGFYHLRLEYKLPESRGVAAERTVLINGEIPFENARSITFSRIWTDGGSVRKDNQGNEIRPVQVETFDWQTSFCRDDMGFIVDPYEFWFEKGDNTITFEAVNEPMILRSLTLCAVRPDRTYEEYLKEAVALQDSISSKDSGSGSGNASAADSGSTSGNASAADSGSGSGNASAADSGSASDNAAAADSGSASASASATDNESASDSTLLMIQGEDSVRRSESSLYAKYDRSSPTTIPNSVTHTVLNYAGGETWRKSGQWIEWSFEVPADDWYTIMIKARQNYSRGSVSSRSVSIDGEIPFDALKEVSFAFSNDWECRTLADEEGTPYRFYLKKGEHTLRLEATLGGMGSILEQMEDCTYRLNQIYRKVLVYTGANPDPYRDYHIDTSYPEIMQAMKLESMRLYKIVDDMVAYSGQKAEQIATAQTVAQQLERFCEKPNKITTEFVNFKDNITALGTASLNLSDIRLDVDYIAVAGPDAQMPVDKANIFTSLAHEAKSFIASFFVDYNSVGDVYDDKTDRIVKVWVMTGRDQGTILKSMVDDSFIPDTGIKVNVEIVDPNALLNAVLAGRGPNVVLSAGADQPVNYALRNAVEDITQFPGWEDVLSHYSESSYEQYRLDDHIYAVPETQTFNVMFYRKDVLDELGLEVPQTWKELIEMFPTIQGNNLSVGIPTAAGSSSAAAASTSIMSNVPDLSLYFSLLFQYGGDMYNEAGTKTTVDSEAGIRAFDDYVRYFNDYGIPTVYDFVSRFRSGEMPLGIAAYSTYNTLMVSAPEIRGLWDFTLIPGTEVTQEDGTVRIDRSDFITGSATMMIATEDEELRKDSWEFMRWWADPQTQVRFGREIEALLGSSARYATANRDAFANLSWSMDDIAVLSAQWDETRGIREVPGGYFTGRHISNAIRKVLNEKEDSRETIIDYSIKIDEEITKKRREFGMPVD